MSLRPLVQLLRPRQWPKNALVLIGLLLANAWHLPGAIASVLAAGMAFCLLSSAVYVFNDLMDREQDRLHPAKRLRPLACGSVGVGAALGLMAFCLATAFALAFFAVPQTIGALLAYLLINIAYTLHLKQIVIIDVFIVASGFMLRLLAGMLAVEYLPYDGLLLAAALFFLFIGFCQRRRELDAMRVDASSGHRRVLQQYSQGFLDQTIVLTAVAAVVTYGMYALYSSRLWLASLCMTYGVLRQLYLMQRRTAPGAGPDGHTVAAIIVWLLSTMWAAMP